MLLNRLEQTVEMAGTEYIIFLPVCWIGCSFILSIQSPSRKMPLAALESPSYPTPSDL